MKKIIVFAIGIVCWSVIESPAQCTTFPVIDLGADTALCDTALLLNAGNPGMNFSWSTGATSQMISANSSGVYSVTVTDTAGCSSSDTINVTLSPPSMAGTIYLGGGDTILCGNEYTLFYIGPHDGYVLWWAIDTTNQAWAPFGSGDTLDYGQAPNNVTGVYTFVATITNFGCPPDTSNFLNIAFYTSPEVDLGPDYATCDTNYVILSPYPTEQNLWSTGSTGSTAVAYVSGIYWCTVTFASGCADTDSIALTIIPMPTVTWNFPVDTVCITDGAILLSGGSPPGGIYGGSDFSNGYFVPSMGGGLQSLTYLWEDSITHCYDSVTHMVYVDTCVGIQEIADDDQIQVYPNPASRSVVIPHLESNETLYFVDAHGQILSVPYTMCAEETTADISMLADGLYFVRITGTSGVHWTSFLKQSQ